MSTRQIACSALVGRSDELATIERQLSLLSAGGRALLVGGEAGVGKTRLVGEVRRLAESGGLTVLAGACVEHTVAPYAPIIAALRRHTRTLDDAHLQRLFDGPSRLAASLLPEVAGIVRLAEDVRVAPEHLDAALWHLVRRLGHEHGVLMVVEDIHWAGVDTLRVLGHLIDEAATLPLWLVVTYRSDEIHRRHPLAPLLPRWRRSPGTEEVQLEALSREGLRTMISALFDGTEVGDEMLDAVMARTGGNPFATEELCAVLVERGDIYHSGGDWVRRSLPEMAMPSTVRETLVARVARLSPETVDALQLAAVAGERVDARILVHLLGAETADRALVESLDHQILVERRDGGYAFRHALLREALADDLVGPARQAAHRRMADALVAVHATDLDAVAAEIGEHLLAAGVTDGARDFALRAAQHAVARGAPAAAVQHYDAAVRLLPAPDERRLAVLVQAATRLRHAEAVPEAVIAFGREARELAHARGDAEAEVEALLAIAAAQWRAGDSEGSVVTDREAVAVAERHGDDRVLALALQSLVRVLVLRGSSDEGASLLARAIEVAERAGDHSVLAHLHASAAMSARSESETSSGFDEAIRHALLAGDGYAEMMAYGNAGYVNIWLGRPGEGVSRSDRAIAIAGQVGPMLGPYWVAGRAWGRAVIGDLDGALEDARAASAVSVSAGPTTHMVALTAFAEVALARGELEEARRCAEENWRLAAPTSEGQRIEPALAHRLRVCNGSGADATEVVARIWDAMGRMGTHGLLSADLAAWLESRADVDGLRRLVDAVTGITQTNPHRMNTAALDVVAGVLAAVTDDAPLSMTRLRSAAAAYRAMPYPLREAETLLRLGEVALTAGSPAVAEDAAARVDEIATRLRSPWLHDAASRLRARTQVDVVLATVLVTDIVGSTERAAAAGDRVWRATLERHHAILRRELSAQRGREIDTAGDGMLAAFDAPARAIRCATAALRTLSAAGIPVRAGVHTGECEVIGDKLAGITVHTAARVAASAGAGEVLVSHTVRDLVAGSGFALEDRGTRQLKGVPGEWRLFAVLDGVR